MDVVDAAAVVLAALEVSPSAPADLTPLVRDCRSLEALLNASGVQGAHPLTRYLTSSIDRDRIMHWSNLLRRDVSESGRYRPVIAGQPEYPRRLNQVWDAPPLLFVRGTLADDSLPAVAVIGARAADTETLCATNEVAFTLAASHIDVLSGLALGVDSAAHRGALSANGHTTAVMGTGIEVVFPLQHSGLAEEVGRRGALVSEFPPYAPHTRTSFLRRNCTIAAMSDTLVVMDAAARSGSRHAVRRAVEYGRPVMMWAPTLEGEAWAIELADAGHGSFFSEPVQLVDAVRGRAQ